MNDKTFVTADIEGQLIRVAIKRNSRAKRLTLRVPKPGQDPVLSMPVSTPLSVAEAFVDRQKGWLHEMLAKRPEFIPFRINMALPFRGRDHVVLAGHALRGTVEHGVTNGLPSLTVFGEDDHKERRLRDWLKKQAKQELCAQVAHFSDQIGKKPSHIRVKDTRSRWGSCSSTGGLSFSWRLIMAPAFILDYVCAHEVSHLTHMDHSRNFWALCEELYPRTQEAKFWIRRHGASLHRYL